MQVRHRIPTIFNLSMVDVLCCALGCVILLWLLNLREAKEKALSVGQTSERLKTAQFSLDQTAALLKSVTTERDANAKRAEAAARERDQVRKELQNARAELAVLDKSLASLRLENTSAEQRIDKLTRDQQSLVKDRAEAIEQLANLEALLRAKEKLVKSAANRAEELADQIRDAEAKAKKLQADVDKYRVRLTAAEAKAESVATEAGDRRKDLAAATRALDLLGKEKKDLTQQVHQARAAADNRFAGIQLTGKRVIFLVDMSGSMELVDERTPDAQKWIGVRETLAKVMRSLPELEKFQVLIFSEKVNYLLGNQGQWLDYDAQTSPNRVLQALAAIKPQGATNMHDAFETAFRFRAQGLDTIYVLSDGLPNDGPGLTPEQARLPKEEERSEILARYIRNLLRRDWNRPSDVRPRVRINTIGFFFESPDVGAFLWALARENDGSFVGMSKP